MDSLDVTKLGNDYQILTELHATAASRTYLARHLRLNRDVVITAYGAAGPRDREALVGYAEDVKRLAALRHPNIVPVIDGRWISDDSFAVILARVRGTTLQQIVTAEGAMPPAQVDDALRNVASALAWARGKGIVHRQVSPNSLVFQQGSGRPLLSFEPATVTSDDAQTIRALASVMSGGAAVNITEYLEMLAPGATVPTPLSPTMTVLETPHGVPAAAGPAVVPVRRGMGFGARVLTAAIIITALVIIAVLLVRWRAARHPAMATEPRSHAVNGAAGEVALSTPSYQVPPSGQVYPTPRIIEPSSPMPSTSSMPMTPTPMMSPMMPGASPPAEQPPAAPPAGGAACSSPASSDQHACLMSAILDHDRELNAVYRQLIAALQRQAGGDSNPSAVRSLRAEEQRWIEERDRACRSVGSEPFYARDRAACFAEQSDRRTLELRQMLGAIPPGA
jgi:uncharacterized protein YecT (DUF1311 family)